MSTEYSQADKSRAGRKLVLVFVAFLLLNNFPLVIPEGPVRYWVSLLVSVPPFMYLGITLFRTLEIRGWSYKWNVAAHIVWLLLSVLSAIGYMLFIAFSYTIGLCKQIAEAPETVPAELLDDPQIAEACKQVKFISSMNPEFANGTPFFAAQLVMMVAGCGYLLWSCISVFRSRRDYNPLPSEVFLNDVEYDANKPTPPPPSYEEA